jgi:excisionase family DNA binding protein
MKRPPHSRPPEDGVEQEPPRSASRDRSIGKMRTIPQTAEILETSERTVQRLIQRKKLRAHYFGRLVRIADADIAALLNATRTF